MAPFPRLYPNNLTFLALLLALLACSPTLAKKQWQTYKNDSFGYSIVVPSGLVLAKRDSDNSGAAWQTGTFRVQVSGTNNPYQIKPQEYFANVKQQIGSGLVREKHGEFDGSYWYDVLYTRDSRRIHRKIFIGSGSIHQVEVSYAYKFREQKELLANAVITSFRPGRVDLAH